jgi:hypothetical protein
VVDQLLLIAEPFAPARAADLFEGTAAQIGGKGLECHGRAVLIAADAVDGRHFRNIKGTWKCEPVPRIACIDLLQWVEEVSMIKHPKIVVPDVGPMDHAWDLLGEWQAEFDVPEASEPVRGKMTFRSWTDAELVFDPEAAAQAGIPPSLELERTSEVFLTDAGGGALQWVLHAPSTNWSLQATMWPGSLHLFVHEGEDEEQLCRGRATRDGDYYLRKYP